MSGKSWIVLFLLVSGGAIGCDNAPTAPAPGLPPAPTIAPPARTGGGTAVASPPPGTVAAMIPTAGKPTAPPSVPGPTAEPATWTFDTDPMGGLPAGATVFSGNWVVRPEAGAPSPANALCQTGNTTYPALTLAGAGYADLTVSTHFKPISGQRDQAAGILFRSQDRDNYYILRANALENNVNLFKYRAGTRSLIGEGTAPVQSGQWQTLRVMAVGPTLQGFLNDQLVVQATDATYQSGGVGRWTKADSVTCFDNVAVTVIGPGRAVPPAPPTPTPAVPPVAPPTTPTITDIALPGDTSRFDYQSLDSQTGLLFIAHLGASTVIVFDTRTAQVVATIPAIADVHGVLAVPALGRVYASATGTNQMAVIDEQSLRVIARVPTGAYPDGLAYDPKTRRVFVSDQSGGTNTVIDTATDTRVATVALGGEAGNSQYDAGADRIWVAVQTRNQLVAIDPATNAVGTRYDLPGCARGHGLLIDAPARRAYVACESNARLLVVDLDSGRVLDTQAVGDDPDVLAFDPAWGRLYVAAESGVLTIFDTGQIPLRPLYQGQFAAGAHSVAVDPVTHTLYLPLADSGGRPVLRIVHYPSP